MKADLRPGARATQGPAPRSLHVMLVEDDEDHVFLIRRALRDLSDVSVQLDVARSGEQALELLGRAALAAGPLPDLVLLDLRMPGMDGFEVLRRVRGDDRLRALPVVALTSSEREDDRDQALRLGVTWYVCKPIDGARFRTEVQQVVALWGGSAPFAGA
jgi:two-component system, response regulator